MLCDQVLLFGDHAALQDNLSDCGSVGYQGTMIISLARRCLETINIIPFESLAMVLCYQ
jgi:hypothetical protein